MCWVYVLVGGGGRGGVGLRERKSWLWICKKKINWLKGDLKNNLASKISKKSGSVPKFSKKWSGTLLSRCFHLNWVSKMFLVSRGQSPPPPPPPLRPRLFINLSVCFYVYISILHRRAHTYITLLESRHDKTNKMSVRQAKTQISLWSVILVFIFLHKHKIYDSHYVHFSCFGVQQKKKKKKKNPDLPTHFFPDMLQ